MSKKPESNEGNEFVPGEQLMPDSVLKDTKELAEAEKRIQEVYPHLDLSSNPAEALLKSPIIGEEIDRLADKE